MRHHEASSWWTNASCWSWPHKCWSVWQVPWQVSGTVSCGVFSMFFRWTMLNDIERCCVLVLTRCWFFFVFFHVIIPTGNCFYLAFAVYSSVCYQLASGLRTTPCFTICGCPPLRKRCWKVLGKNTIPNFSLSLCCSITFYPFRCTSRWRRCWFSKPVSSKAIY